VQIPALEGRAEPDATGGGSGPLVAGVVATVPAGRVDLEIAEAAVQEACAAPSLTRGRGRSAEHPAGLADRCGRPRPSTGCDGKSVARRKKRSHAGRRGPGRLHPPRTTSGPHLHRPPGLDPAVGLPLTLRSVCGAAHRGDRRPRSWSGADHGPAAGPCETQDPAWRAF